MVYPAENGVFCSLRSVCVCVCMGGLLLEASSRGV